MATVAVTGYKGRLGTELITRYGLTPMPCDITVLSEVEEFLADVKPDVIINCAARTDVDKCEETPIETLQTNTYAIRHITDNFKGYFIQLSTDFIFTGSSLNGYDEQEMSDCFINVYGMSKYMAEVGLRNRLNTLIVRTTVLYDAKSKNFVTSIVKKLTNNEPIQVIDDYVGSPTYVPHLAEGLMKAIEMNLTGIVNISGSDRVNRYQLANIIAKKLGLDYGLISPTKNDWSKVKRPKSAGFNVGKAKKLGIPIYSLEEGLEAFKKEYLHGL
jgi:dTDP-4-dehydrorhamnose reductase